MTNTGNPDRFIFVLNVIAVALALVGTAALLPGAFVTGWHMEPGLGIALCGAISAVGAAILVVCDCR